MIHHVIQRTAKPEALPTAPDLSALSVASLTAESSDDAMLTVLRTDEVLVGRVQAAARMAYEAARKLPGGPVQDVDYRWTQAQSASNAAILEAGGRGVIGIRCAADWTARVKLLRVALQVGDYFRDLVTRWPTMPQGERDAMVRKAWAEGTGRAAQAMPIGVAMAPAAFDALPLLADLARRGVHLWVSEAGSILARPGRGLTAKDRETIGIHKAAFLAALGDEVAVA